MSLYEITLKYKDGRIVVYTIKGIDLQSAEKELLEMFKRAEVIDTKFLYYTGD